MTPSERRPTPPAQRPDQTTARDLLRQAWLLTPCPLCQGTGEEAVVPWPTKRITCRSCRAQGHASLAQFAPRELSRGARGVARMLAGKAPIRKEVIARCEAILAARHIPS